MRTDKRVIYSERMHSWAQRISQESVAMARCTTPLARKVLANELKRRYVNSRNRYGKTHGKSVRMMHLEESTWQVQHKNCYRYVR